MAIFEFDRDDWKYLGVFFGIFDIAKFSSVKELQEKSPGILGIIWINENEDCIARLRFKNTDGNKIAFESNYGKNHDISFILDEVKKGIKGFEWYPNEDKTLQGLINLFKSNPWVEKFETEKK